MPTVDVPSFFQPDSETAAFPPWHIPLRQLGPASTSLVAALCEAGHDVVLDSFGEAAIDAEAVQALLPASPFDYRL